MTAVRTTDTDQSPWYRQPYVWLLIAFPAASVIAGLATFVTAARTYDGLVVDDYYRRGLEINRELARDRAAELRKLGAAVELVPGAARFRVLLAAGTDQRVPRSLRVSFLHRTRAGLDRRAVATLLTEPGAAAIRTYEAAAPDLARGHWDVLIEAADWRLLESVTVN
jgi:hypothetical protein